MDLKNFIPRLINEKPSGKDKDLVKTFTRHNQVYFDYTFMT